MVEVSTSILTVEKENILGTIYNLETAKTDYYHIDVMDGKFVEKNTTEIMQEYCNNIKQISNVPLDVHLMVEDIQTYIDLFIPYSPNIITFHLEACSNKEEILNIIKYIKENGIKVGLSIKPNTKIEEILEFLPLIHLILIMTVEPGKGGQKLIPGTINKVKQLKEYTEKNNIDIDIEVDGGINLENKEELKQAGANILVAGNAIISSKNYKETIQKIKECTIKST